MMAAPRPSAGLPSSIAAIHLPAFKRKRIEQWCEDVAQYLKAGSLCRSVIGHTTEDSRLPGPTVKSAPAGSHHRTQHTSVSATMPTTSSGTTIATTNAAVTATSMGTVTEMLSFNHNKNNASNSCGLTGAKTDSAPPPGRGTPMPDASGPLPVVKFSYSHYNEQRRRVDRLVQGLPVLSSTTPNAGVDRLGGNSGAVVFVNGEETVKSAGLGMIAGGSKADRVGRASPAPGPGPAPRSNSRSSSGEPRQRPLPAAHVSRHQSVSPTPTPTRNLPHHTTSSSHPHRGPQGSGKVQSSEIVVIEDEFRGQGHHTDLVSSGLRSMRLNGLRRSQSQKVHKARQRVLAGTRRSGEHNTHTSVPVQSCWALAELTW
ncbi:uncharacterized protein LOC143285093 [Babylonia areolata]|uniref:uncharacterized protein LOC143285093 n=1 Tax=Babylonia areolata TaxID=304850 RepID=UPI003FD6A863